jgi:hypothetical protein
MKIQKIAMEYITCQVSACGKKYKRNNSFVWQTCYSAVVDTSRNGGGGANLGCHYMTNFCYWKS